ncbi:hypothetical protein EK904_009471 [Melospiza melodia maxima]|nr:hypothetical protein EK904_009471 [Melospiza melodia maxima]
MLSNIKQSFTEVGEVCRLPHTEGFGPVSELFFPNTEHHPELRSLNGWNANVPQDSDHEKLTTNQILAARQNIKSHFELGVDPAGSVTFAQESSMSWPSIVWHIQAHMALCTHVHRKALMLQKDIAVVSMGYREEYVTLVNLGSTYPAVKQLSHTEKI